jgi:hypothetical protein
MLVRNESSWHWYINAFIDFFGHYPSSCYLFKSNVSEMEVYLVRRLKQTHLDLIYRTSPYLWRQGLALVIMPTSIGVLPEDGGRVLTLKCFSTKNRVMGNVQKGNNCIIM